ncbi:MAG: hypothetical protein J0L93_00920 [Deltaproteobacteria bacterium]|nr:hypothetical protein [Deltaproteobacteria bacterium]
MKLFHLAIALISLVASACGSEEFFIADKVKFKVSFEEKTVQVAFDLQKDYQIKTQKTVDYESLGDTYLAWDEISSRNNIGSKLSASEDSLKNAWPTEELKLFPNGKALPPATGDSILKNWKKTDEKMRWDFFYQSEPKLMNGGSILSTQFDQLPKNFLAIQNFRLKNGNVIASIAVMGPTAESMGGLFFIGNYGSNPYSLQQDSPSDGFSISTNLSASNEWEMEAIEPAEIISYGKFYSMPILSLSPKWFIDLQTQIENFSN